METFSIEATYVDSYVAIFLKNPGLKGGSPESFKPPFPMSLNIWLPVSEKQSYHDVSFNLFTVFFRLFANLQIKHVTICDSLHVIL